MAESRPNLYPLWIFIGSIVGIIVGFNMLCGRNSVSSDAAQQASLVLLVASVIGLAVSILWFLGLLIAGLFKK